MEFLPFLKEQEIFHFRGKPLLNGLFGVEKKNKNLESGEPVLRMIINAIPANALQDMIEADIRTMPFFVQWSGISVDEEDRVELDMTSAFHVFPPRAGVVQVPGSGETRFGAVRFKVCSICGPRKACSLRWQSWPWDGSQRADSCNRSTGSFASSQNPWEQDWTRPGKFDAMDLFREAAGPQDASFCSVYLDGFSHAELKHWSQLSNPEKWSWEAEAVHEAWHRWGVPSQTEKAIINGNPWRVELMATQG